MSPLMCSSWVSRWVARWSSTLGWNVDRSWINTWMSHTDFGSGQGLPGQTCPTLRSKSFFVEIDISTTRVAPQSKATGTGSLWSGHWDLRRTVKTIYLANEQCPEWQRVTWKCIRWSLMLMRSGSTSQKERQWCNPNSWQGLWRWARQFFLLRRMNIRCIYGCYMYHENFIVNPATIPLH